MLLFALTDGSRRPKWDVISHISESFQILWRQWIRLKVINSLLYREFHDTEANKVILQLVVPKQRRPDVIHYFHDIPNGAHLGVEKSIIRMRNSLYWSSMTKEITWYSKRCDFFAARKSCQRQNRVPQGNIWLENPCKG